MRGNYSADEHTALDVHQSPLGYRPKMGPSPAEDPDLMGSIDISEKGYSTLSGSHWASKSGRIMGLTWTIGSYIGDFIEYILYPMVAFWAGLFQSFSWLGWLLIVVLYAVIWLALRSPRGLRAVSKRGRRVVETWIVLVSILIVLDLFLTYKVVPDVEDKVMVIYCKENMWPPGHITAGLFSSMKHVLGAIAYGERHGAAAVRVEFVDRYYTDAEMASPNYWGYYFDEVLSLSL